MKNHYEEVCDIIQNDLFLIENRIGESIDSFNVFQTEPKIYVINLDRVFKIEDNSVKEVSVNSDIYRAVIAEYVDYEIEV